MPPALARPGPVRFTHTEKHEPASKYWSFHLAVEHGFIDTNYPTDACLHPPATDWAEGDFKQPSADLAVIAVGGGEEAGSDSYGSGVGTPELEEVRRRLR